MQRGSDHGSASRYRLVRLFAVRAFAAAMLMAGLTVAPPPTVAQGTLTPPSGQKTVTAPGGVGRGKVRGHRMHRMRRRHR